jgi:hypothetical protein
MRELLLGGSGTGTVVPLATNTALPSVTAEAVIGTANVGAQGAWDGDPDQIENKWQIGDGTTWIDIPDATDYSAYTPVVDNSSLTDTGSDFGYLLRLSERAHTAGGWSEKVYSEASDTVQGESAVSYVSNLITNGDMESGDPPASWTTYHSVLSSVADERTGGAGSHSMAITDDGVNSSGKAFQNLSPDSTKHHALSVWLRNVDATRMNVILTNPVPTGGALPAVSNFTGTSWTRLVGVFRPGSGYNTGVSAVFDSPGQSGHVDDFELKPEAEIYRETPTPNPALELALDTLEDNIGSTAGLDFRMQDYQNKWTTLLYRDIYGVWRLRLFKEVGGTQTSFVSEVISKPNVIRVNAYSDQISVWYSTDGGESFTQAGSTATDSAFVDEVGVSAFCSPDTVLGKLRYTTATNPYDGSAEGWFASAEGSQYSVGSIDDPMTLDQGLANNDMAAGDQLTLLHGTFDYGDDPAYTNMEMDGEEENEIVITNEDNGVSGAEAIINHHGVKQVGSDVIWKGRNYGLVFRDDSTDRDFPSSPHWQADSLYVNGDSWAARMKAINIRFEHPIGNAVDWFGHQDGELYGLVAWGCGFNLPDRWHGTGLYTHQSSYLFAKSIRSCFFLNGGHTGAQVADGGGKDACYNYTLEDVTANVRLFAGNTAADNLVVRRLWALGAYPEFGLYAAAENGSLLLEDSVIDDLTLQYLIDRYATVTVQNCKFTAAAGTLNEVAGGSDVTLTGNTVISSGNYCNLVTNVYENAWGMLSILDLDEGGSVDVDMTDNQGGEFAANGETVRIFNPCTWTEYQDVVVSGGGLVVPMGLTNWTAIPIPPGMAEYPSGDEFFSDRHGAFVLANLG